MAGVGTLVIAGQPAQASTQKFVIADSLAYIDSRNPTTAFTGVDGPAPVGSWRDDDGKHHVSRSYFTFDLSAYRGKDIQNAYIVGTETEVNDCDKTRRVEIWRTAAVTSTSTWRTPPAEIAKIGEFGQGYYGCPSSYLGATVLGEVRAAVATDTATLTVELRIPEDTEGNPHLGRKFSRRFGISITANSAPNTPTGLMVDQRPCDGPDQILTASSGPVLSATSTDPDTYDYGGGDRTYATFALWPVDDPSARTEWSDIGPADPWYPYVRLFLPWQYLTDGTYAFQVKAHDDDVESGWSAECRFTVDTARPAGAPTVTSSDYPSDDRAHTGAGVPGDFTFAISGVNDLAGFYYGFWEAYSFIAAGPDGSVTLPITPTSDGPQILRVVAVDKAGNRSESTDYQFYVASTSPTVEDADTGAWPGDPHHLTFSPGMDGVVSYTYRVDYGPEQEIAADAEQKAHLTLTPDLGYTYLTVHSKTASGIVSGEGSAFIAVESAPVASSTDWPSTSTPGLPYGSTGTVKFAPHMHGVVEYVYTIDGGEQQIVAAGADGTATISVTPAHAWNNSIEVFSRTADGVESEVTYYSIYVGSVAPKVSSAEYPYYFQSGGIGVPGTFTFQPTAADVVEYSYQFGQDDEVIIPAGPDGIASVTWTPKDYTKTWYGGVTVVVRSHSASGFVSDEQYYTFFVNPSAPLVESAAIYPGQSRVGEPITMTFTSGIPGTVEFVYRLGYSGEEQVIAAGPDGKATVTYTPDSAWAFVNVYVRSTDGLVSGSTYQNFNVTPS